MITALPYLIKLQKIDSEIIEKSTFISNPSNFPKIDKNTPLDSHYQRIKENCEILRKNYIKKKKEIMQLKEHIIEHKNTRNNIGTNVALDKYEKKLEALKFMLKEEENALLKITEATSEHLEELKKTRALIDSYNKEKEEEFLKKNSKLRDYEFQLKKLYEERKSLVSLIPIDIYDFYMNHLEAFNGNVVVQVIDMICQGCYITLPRYIYIRLLNSDSIHFCLNCSRIIYRESSGYIR